MPDALSRLLLGLADPLLDPASRMFWPTLLSAAGVAAVLLARRGVAPRALARAVFAPELWRHRSSRLDLQVVLVRQCLGLLGLLPSLASAWWLAGWTARGLGALAPAGLAAGLDPRLAGAVYTLTLFVAWDLSRYLLHRAMHELPALWELHQVHHSAEVLTPLTFFRVHPLESLLYEARGVLVTGLVAGTWAWAAPGGAAQATLLGVHALGFLFNAVSGNLRHSHVWWSFGPRVERWLVSPAQHQLHHAADPALYGINYGTWLAIWDRMGGSWRAADAPPAAYGLAEANHAPDDVLGALVQPVLGMLRVALPSRRTA